MTNSEAVQLEVAFAMTIPPSSPNDESTSLYTRALRDDVGIVPYEVKLLRRDGEPVPYGEGCNGRAMLAPTM